MIAIVSADKFKEHADLMAQIAEALEELRKASAPPKTARKKLFGLIRLARDKGVRSADISDLTGYSRQRVWQICEEKEDEAEPE